jgi:hypothetical protein
MALNLKIIPCNNIVPLTDYSRERVASLEIAISDSGTIKNPLLTAVAGCDKLLLLDDAAILETARRLKIEYLPVQITEFKDDMKIPTGVCIKNWSRECIGKFRKVFPRVFASPVSSEESKHENRFAEIIITDSESEPLRIWFKRDSKNRLPGAYFDFLTFLKRHFGFSHCYCLDNRDSLSFARNKNIAIMNCPDITAGDIAAASASGHLFPAELFTFDCGSRILGINYPVHILNDSVPVEDKEQFLHELINLRINSGNTRYISSGVYLLNY